MASRYVRNEAGFIHSVSEEHFQKLLVTSGLGNQYLPPGWEEVDEATARLEQPTLFGAPDPEVLAGATIEDLDNERKRQEARRALGDVV